MVTIPGTMSEKFFFTVHNDSIAAKLNQSLGHRVTITYRQHVGIPSTCFGETPYFVNEVKVIE
jgi:hypothetical protein